MRNNQPFIYHGGNFIDTINVRKRNDADISGYPYLIEMGNISLSLTGQDLTDLVFSLATAAHDGGFIDDATARRLSYIGQSYFEQDRPLPEPDIDLTDEQGEDYEAQR